MVWLILLLISLFLVFFIRGVRRGARGEREALVPRRPAHPAADAETADEPGLTRDRRQHGGLVDTEYSDEFERKTSMDFDGDLGTVRSDPEGGEEVDFDAMVDEIHRKMVRTPLHRGGIDTDLVEPEWEIVGVMDAEGDVEGGGEGKEILASHDLRTDPEANMEFALEVDSVSIPQERITLYDSSLPVDHVLRIGMSPERVSGFDMPIQMQLSPALVALAKDPYWAFVYWVLPQEAPTGEWELRVRNLTNQSEFFQRVDPGAHRWYLQLNEPDSRFLFELGIRDQTGQFHPVLMSNELMMPPDRPSSVVDAEWLTVDEFYRYQGRLDPKGSPAFIMEFGGASEQMVRSQK